MTGDALQEMEDVCALPLVRRVAALLDRDPGMLRAGDPLPRGWHVALFTVPTRQSALRPDGLGGLGVDLPDLGLPRIMAGGRQTTFHVDIPIGAAVHRLSRTETVTPKQGRSGPLALVSIRHDLFVGNATVLTERQDYVMLPERVPGSPAAPATPPQAPAPADTERRIVADEAMLLRYCAVTFNTHRIHYDHPYATQVEGYSALVVNAGLPVLFLLDLFRAEAGREPATLALRNLASLYCNRPIRLCSARGAEAWRLWAEDDEGRIAVEARLT
jgi:3-methylfumaryl-CoA hydratase